MIGKWCACRTHRFRPPPYQLLRHPRQYVVLPKPTRPRVPQIVPTKVGQLKIIALPREAASQSALPNLGKYQPQRNEIIVNSSPYASAVGTFGASSPAKLCFLKSNLHDARFGEVLGPCNILNSELPTSIVFHRAGATG